AFFRKDADVLVIKFYGLHLGRRLPLLSSVSDPVSAEIIICGPLCAVPAICLKLSAVPVLLRQGLINVIPDKASLIQRFCVCKICIPVHGAAGVPHGVKVFTADKGLASVLLKKLRDLCRRCVHLAFYVAGIVVPPVMKDTFIMYQSRGILPLKLP